MHSSQLSHQELFLAGGGVVYPAEFHAFLGGIGLAWRDLRCWVVQLRSSKIKDQCVWSRSCLSAFVTAASSNELVHKLLQVKTSEGY